MDPPIVDPTSSSTTSASSSATPQFHRLRVRVRYYTDALGTSRQSDLTRQLLFGRQFTTALPFVCSTHKLRFADIAKLASYQLQVRVFFSTSVQTAMVQQGGQQGRQWSDDDDDRSGNGDDRKQTIVQYNFWNMMRILFPTTLPNPAGLHTTDRTRDPPSLAALSLVRSVVPQYSYIYPGASSSTASSTSTSGSSSKGGSATAAMSATTTSPLFRAVTRRRRRSRWTRGGREGLLRSAQLLSSPSSLSHSTTMRQPEEERRRRRVHWSDPIAVAGGKRSDDENAQAGEDKDTTSETMVHGGARPPPPPPLNTEFHTVFRTTWLNDARNHPVYADLINSILRYRAWWLTIRSGKLDPPATTAPPPDPRAPRPRTSMLAVEQKRFVDQLPRLKAKELVGTALERMHRPDGTTVGSTGGGLAGTFFSDLIQLKKQLALLSSSSSASADNNNLRIVELVGKLYQLQIDLRENRAVATVIGSDQSTINLAIQALQPMLTAFQPVQNLMDAFAAIDSMNTQYKTLRPDLVTFMTRTFPQFVEIMDTLQSFALTYVSSNLAWRRFFQTVLTSTTDVAEVFNAMHAKCVRLSRDDIGADEEELLPLGLDLNITKTSASQKSDGGEDEGSSTLSQLPVYEAYVQMDLIGFVVGPENVRSIKCGFADFLIGVQFDRIVNPPIHAWQVPRRLFYPAPNSKR